MSPPLSALDSRDGRSRPSPPQHAKWLGTPAGGRNDSSRLRPRCLEVARVNHHASGNEVVFLNPGAPAFKFDDPASFKGQAGGIVGRVPASRDLNEVRAGFQ